MSAIASPIKAEMAQGKLQPGSTADKENVGESERWLSVIGGGLLGLYGLREGHLGGLALAGVGGALAHRGLSGHCALYKVLGMSTKEHGLAAAVGAGRGIKVVRAVTIQCPAQELYEYWRHLENLPSFMTHLVSVIQEDGMRSHWVANAPAGITAEWDAEIVNKEPFRLIAWRSLSGSQIATAGSVHFTPLSNDRGTEVRVSLKYDPPGGQLGSWLAWAFDQDPGQQIREDLRRFRQLMESGEMATTHGQSSCREGACS